MQDNENPYPRGGDAVRLTLPWRPDGYPEQDATVLAAGEIGVLQGLAGRRVPGGLCTVAFRHHTFRGQDLPEQPKRIASTGVYATRVRVGDLRPTDETTTLTVWRWNDAGPGPGNGVEYAITVRVWEWEPTK